MKQSEVFLSGEGKAWLDRNIDKIDPENDPVLLAIDQYRIEPKRVLEIGCANGWRLDILERVYGCSIAGVDPGLNTVWPHHLMRGSAACPPLGDDSFDTIIYGWSLYLCDPEDYFRIAEAGDRALKDGGYLIVYDFHTDHPYKTPYKHKKGLFSHHYEFEQLWLGHPAYSLYGRTVQGETSVTILHKDLKNSFQVER